MREASGDDVDQLTPTAEVGMKQSFVFVVVLAASLVRPSGRAAAETPTEKRLRLLEEKLRQAEEEIRELKGQVQQQKAIGQATQKQVEQTADEAKPRRPRPRRGLSSRIGRSGRRSSATS